MPNEWDDFTMKHRAGDLLEGRVVNVTDFGLFIDVYHGLEGLAHVSEVDVPAGTKLEDHFKVGEWVRTRVLRVEEEDKKVGLSLHGVTQPTEEEIAELEASRGDSPVQGEEPEESGEEA